MEMHRWSAFLTNQEKVAELQGHLATVTTSFDPEEKTITLSKPVPQAWIDWLNAPAHEQYLSERDPVDKKKYFYLRLWTGGSGDANAPDHPFTPGTAVELLGTGLNVTFSQPGLPGDYWIIAARPNTPDVVVPWELMAQAPPAGTRFFFTPLALILWFVDPEPSPTVNSQILDCRHKFRPLCEVEEGSKVSTGLVVFQDVQPGDGRASPLIAHGLGVNYVAIVMAVEFSESILMGDLEESSPGENTGLAPRLTARYRPSDPSRQFIIALQDRRPAGEFLPVTWPVRWWAIPKTLDQPDVIVPPESLGEANIIVVDPIPPAPLNFLPTDVNTTVFGTITIKNTGTAPLVVTSITRIGDSFGVMPPTEFTVAPTEERIVTVSFTPRSAGAQTGTLSINSNDPGEPTVHVQLQGIGRGPAPQIEVFPTEFDFGPVDINTTADLSITIKNKGNAPLEVDRFRRDGSFRFVVRPPTKFTVAPTEERIVTVSFTPTEPQEEYTATLTIVSNDLRRPTVSLQGQGFEPPQ